MGHTNCEDIEKKLYTEAAICRGLLDPEIYIEAKIQRMCGKVRNSRKTISNKVRNPLDQPFYDIVNYVNRITTSSNICLK